MPPDPADVVRQAFLANNRGDLDGFLARVAEDVEWHSAGLFLYPERIWHGRDGVRTGVLQARGHRGGAAHVTLRELAAREDAVLTLAAVSVPTAARPVTLPVAWVIDVENEMLRRVRTFRSDRRAVAAWGGEREER